MLEHARRARMTETKGYKAAFFFVLIGFCFESGALNPGMRFPNSHLLGSVVAAGGVGVLVVVVSLGVTYIRLTQESIS